MKAGQVLASRMGGVFYSAYRPGRMAAHVAAIGARLCSALKEASSPANQSIRGDLVPWLQYNGRQAEEEEEKEEEWRC
ncbi:hypothetical protein TARUN_7845 [Trichoderma arundinaceum]|uniref:Uncharacterized protein n=1 Tax=Trichoderma arundinaceum TaxID=490622 RepID=A0A395NEN3_TRIAR|nr:hypothetical protein TARUN_7845 [Trichoderma arundinaceum]